MALNNTNSSSSFVFLRPIGLRHEYKVLDRRWERIAQAKINGYTADGFQTFSFKEATDAATQRAYYAGIAQEVVREAAEVEEAINVIVSEVESVLRSGKRHDLIQRLSLGVYLRELNYESLHNMVHYDNLLRRTPQERAIGYSVYCLSRQLKEIHSRERLLVARHQETTRAVQEELEKSTTEIEYRNGPKYAARMAKGRNSKFVVKRKICRAVFGREPFSFRNAARDFANGLHRDHRVPSTPGV
jgi:hypothetical protein